MITVRKLGIVEYSQGLLLMEEARQRVAKNGATKQGEILSLQHPPVVTLGNRPLIEDIKSSATELQDAGVAFFKTNRGGSATVHEPGQLVVYPIIKLDSKNFGPKQFVFLLEQAMIDTALNFGVHCTRDSKNPGIWVGRNKLGALGIRVVESVSSHGLALNVTNNLSTFNHVIPCGLMERGVTSFRNELPENLTQGFDFFDSLENLLLEKLLSMLQN